MSSTPRRPRRAVRPPGTVGTDESVLRSVLPAPPGTTTGAPAERSPGATGGVAPSGAAARPAPAGAAADDLWRRTRSADDSDHGWGRDESSSDDDRLRREKPPHW